MAYDEQINYLKEALNGYSAEEEKLAGLYKTALENATKAHEAAMKQLEVQYQDDRNEVYADNARDGRNFNNLLAERGLGFSGEAAQAKLNSNITLSNRLGELTKKKNSDSLSLGLDFAEKKSNLSMDEAEKLRTILENKNQLTAEIASLELDKENAAAKLQADKESEAARIQAEKEKLQAEIQAEKELLALKLQAEKEMQEAELNAKYYNEENNKYPGNTGGNGNDNGTENETEVGYIPDVNTSTLAKQLVNTASSGKGYIYSDWHNYQVNKYLLELLENYNIDQNYYKELVFLLKAYGYTETSIPEMRIQVIGYDSNSYYEKRYDELYNYYVLQGYGEGSSHKIALDEAKKQQIDYIYKRCNSIIEFKQCCLEAEISEGQINDYLARIQSAEESKKGQSGGGGGFAQRGSQ